MQTGGIEGKMLSGQGGYGRGFGAEGGDFYGRLGAGGGGEGLKQCLIMEDFTRPQLSGLPFFKRFV